MEQTQKERCFKITGSRIIKNGADAIHYCTMECPDQKLGCAVDCKLRRHFHVPPHGSRWPETEPAGVGRPKK